MGIGPSVEEQPKTPRAGPSISQSCEPARGREEAYMLLSIIGELRIGTSPRPVMATQLIVPERPLRALSCRGELH